jgi:manganese transport protein
MRPPWNRTLRSTEQLEQERQRRAHDRISIRNMFVYLGPALIVSMAYMDPGNYGTGIQSGYSFGYALVWSVWAASIFAMVLQYLSGKLGIATGKALAELVRESIGSRAGVLAYWLAAEAAAAATDLAEYLGTVIALNLLFGIPLIYAAILGAVDVVILLVLTSKRFRIVEYFFMLFVSIISIGFLYEVFLVGPNITQIVTSTFTPAIGGDKTLLVVGIIGATVMPHALFVHSSLTKDRLTGGGVEEKRRLNRLHLRETLFVLTIAALVNVAILVVPAAICAHNPTVSGCNGGTNSSMSIGQFANILQPLYGGLAATVFGITLLASGLASSTTGTLAGQAIMDGLLGLKVNKYIRRLVTRVINVIPTTIAILIGLQLVQLLIYSQVILSLMIPLPMLPLLIYTNKKRLMGEFVNKRITTIIAWIVGVIIIALNVYLLTTVL